MPKIRFTGYVLPRIFVFTANNLAPVKWKDNGVTPLEMEFRISIQTGIVDIVCDLNRNITEVELSTPLIRGLDIVKAIVDCLGFAKGLGLSVVLEKYYDATGKESDIAFKNEPLARLFTAFDLNPANTGKNNFERMYRLVIGEPALFMALNELVGSLYIPHQIPVNCGRAIEGIRKLFAPVGTPRDQEWKLMRENLRLTSSYIELITNESKSPRHGDRTFIPASVLDPILERSWIIMNRFLEFRKRGNQPLPLSEFPEL